MTEAGKWFQDMVARHEREPEYWIEVLKLGFAEEVGRQMERQGVSRAELARRLGTSASYVTKILRTTANLTLESMARIALALDSRVSLGLVSRDAEHRTRREPTRVAAVRQVPALQGFIVSDRPATGEARGASCVARRRQRRTRTEKHE
jgi:transcriptional regulator with XRE-family HTH domain